MKSKFAIVALTAGALLAGCTTGGTKQTVGSLGGAVAGGLVGSQIGGGTGQLIATGAGALLGAFLGSEIGASLDRADQMAAQQTAQRTFETVPTGQSATWRNPDSGHYGTITPTRTYQANNGYCRDYTHTIYIDGRAETARGTACRQSDGTCQTMT
ncbi:MAG TPA: RT0821/Lpp0805 family surface protein [Alphaproteobacteria bacterium]|nr:RT0821/Lpp0805 family surface protein [Alphaproteobacteria bacterium]